jgi:hypothetical protein
MHAVIETPAYLRAADDAGMTDEERADAVDTVARNPLAGDLIPGAGGCRKLRIRGKGRGKSGGYRVVTYFASQDVPVFLVSVLSKNSRANFTRAELNGMAIAAGKLSEGLS